MAVKRPVENEKDPFYDVEKVASFQECTGLVPALPDEQEQVEAYDRLYSVHRQIIE